MNRSRCSGEIPASCASRSSAVQVDLELFYGPELGAGPYHTVTVTDTDGPLVGAGER